MKRRNKFFKTVGIILMCVISLTFSVMAIDVGLGKYESKLLSEGIELSQILEFRQRIKSATGLDAEEFLRRFEENKYADNPFEDFVDYEADFENLAQAVRNNMDIIELLPDTNGKFLNISSEGMYYHETEYDDSGKRIGAKPGYLPLTDEETKSVISIYERNKEFYCVRVYDDYFQLSADNESDQRAVLSYSFAPNYTPTDGYAKTVKINENWSVLWIE
ncbi:MAG: hypothetical protein IJW86_03810 [Clostridia bacterium]|nr:hypothetical protein [Clostridia bacterium]